MKYTKYKIVTLVAFSALLFGGCKKFLDVNTNPNIANNPGVEIVLPSAQVEIAQVLGGQFQINGSFWAQYWTQSPLANQYKQYDQYQTASNDYDRSWTTLYSGALTDLNYVYKKAKETNSKQYMAVSRLLSAYTYQLITDAWGDAPFTEAIQGLDIDGANLSPKYDIQSSIYNGILAQIAEADSLIDPSAIVHPGADDLIYGGDMSLWAKFSNTLKLKIALRLSEVNPTKSQAIIAGIPSDFITAIGEDAKIKFTSDGGNENPLYSEEVALSKTQNIYASKTCVAEMNNNFDPRVFVFYKPLSNGTVVGNIQGDYNNAAAAAGLSIGSAAVGAESINPESAKAPVRFISTQESLLLQAEAVARGWLADDDSTLYVAAIDASFEDYGIDPTSADAMYYKDSTTAGMYPVAGTMMDKIQQIITQKWFGMCGNQGFEAWTEYRRTGFPNFLIQSVNSLIGSKKPARFIYPTDEVNLNANFPGIKQVDQHVWWDIN